jgi:hypothetical protein
VRARRGRAGWCGVRSTACTVQRAAWHHADVLWAAARVAVLVREVRQQQGRRGCVGWSHQFKRVSLGHAGRCWVGSGCPGLPKCAPMVGPGASQLTRMRQRGWCLVGASNGCTNHDCRFVLDIGAGSAAGGGHGCQHNQPAGKHGHMAPVGECG